jgi:hypothetical protein
MQAQTRLQAAIDVATAALGGGLATIEGVHTAIARKPFSALRLAPAVGEVSEVVRMIHDGITGLVYAGIGGAIEVAGGAARRAAVRLAAAEDVEPPPRAAEPSRRVRSDAPLARGRLRVTALSTVAPLVGGSCCALSLA